MTPATAPLDGGISIGSQEDEARSRHQEAAEDEQFTARRAAFVLKALEFHALFSWTNVLMDIGAAYHRRDEPEYYGPGRFAYFVQELASIDGWPATLRAIAQAMVESEGKR